jgi:ABC-type lipoprotein export system ATPase subunit
VNVVTLENYELHDTTTGSHLQNFNFSLGTGEACLLTAEASDDAHLLASALATLVYPVAGRYIFEDAPLDFRNYQNLLKYKREIGYFGPEAAMISNLTVRQNLLLSRTYFENRLDLDLDDKVKALCSAFRLTEKLDLRPTALSSLDIRAAIMAREIAKPLKFLIVDSPEDLFGHSGFSFLVTEVEQMTASGIPLVLLCENDALATRLTDRTVRI